ncbi:MAG: methylated-DNA--[protein]-cysteine S-methyltransferase [Nitrospiraceae bacterium]
MATVCFDSPVGWIGLEVSPVGVRRVMLGVGKRPAVERALRAEPLVSHAGDSHDEDVLLDTARAQLHDYLAGTRQTFDLPIDWTIGTAFQRRVWKATLKIPYGRLRSYGWVATRVGGKQYSRAVGMALGANPVPLIIPCHRVVAQDASLGGFSCGLSIKRQLLRLEGTLAELTRR